MNTRNISDIHGFWTILCKEIVDNIRDRRTLTTMVVSIVIGPLLIFGILWFTEKTVEEETDLVNAQAIQLPVVGAEYAPNLMVWLGQNNIEIIDPPKDIQDAISTGKQRVVLSIDSSYPEAFKKAKTAPVRLIHDGSISGLEKISFHRVQSAIQGYSEKVGALRLIARGVTPEVTQVIQVNISDVSTPQARNAQILTMLPYIVIIFIMVGGMYLAIDTTAGEREKGSLEPLLTQAVQRHIIVLAKLSATIVFSAATFLLVLIGLALAFKYIPIESISLVIGPQQIIKIFITCLPFVFVACAMMVLLASFTKSYKEAQSYLGMLMMVPSLPLILLGLLSPEPSVNNMWVPSLSHGLIMIETLKGEEISASLIGLSAISSMVVAVLLTWVAVKLYQRERILGQ